MQILHRNHGVILGYFEVLGVTACTALEAVATGQLRHRRAAPWTAYPWLTLCLLSSSALSNWSLNFINFPTKVVFRSSKLVPTMILASVLHKQRFSVMEYTCATAICAGLILFAAADWRTTPSFHPVGLLLVILSVIADAVLPNAQQAVFARYHASRLEVTLYTNILTLAAYTVTTTLLTGEAAAWYDILTNRNHPDEWKLPYYLALYTAVSYAAITAHMTIVRKYGGVAAIVVATARKGLTLVLSFCLFPKAWSWYYPAGATLVLGGLGVASYYKQRQARSRMDALGSAKISSKHSDVELQELLAATQGMENDYSDNDTQEEGAIDKSDHGLRHLHSGSDRGSKKSNRKTTMIMTSESSNNNTK